MLVAIEDDDDILLSHTDVELTKNLLTVLRNVAQNAWDNPPAPPQVGCHGCSLLLMPMCQL